VILFDSGTSGREVYRTRVVFLERIRGVSERESRAGRRSDGPT
jgi:hypothetical protein